MVSVKEEICVGVRNEVASTELEMKRTYDVDSDASKVRLVSVKDFGVAETVKCTEVFIPSPPEKH